MSTFKVIDPNSGKDPLVNLELSPESVFKCEPLPGTINHGDITFTLSAFHSTTAIKPRVRMTNVETGKDHINYDAESESYFNSTTSSSSGNPGTGYRFDVTGEMFIPPLGAYLVSVDYPDPAGGFAEVPFEVISPYEMPGRLDLQISGTPVEGELIEINADVYFHNTTSVEVFVDGQSLGEPLSANNSDSCRSTYIFEWLAEAGHHNIDIVATNDIGATVESSDLVDVSGNSAGEEVFGSEGVSITQETVNWSTGTIDISGISSVNVSMLASGVGPMESADYLNIYYRLDGGSRIPLSQNNNAFSERTVSTNELSGNTLEIIVEGQTSYADETYTVFAISVISNGGTSVCGLPFSDDGVFHYSRDC